MVNSVDLALYSFNQGLNLTISEILPFSTVGYYCLKDVTLESLIPGLFEENVRYRILKEWTDKAASYFAKEYRQSLVQVRDLTKTYESMLEKMPKDSQERREVLRKAGWAWLCLATLCQNALEQDATLHETEKIMEDAYEKSRNSFKNIVNNELDDREAMSYILVKTKKPTTV